MNFPDFKQPRIPSGDAPLHFDQPRSYCARGVMTRCTAGNRWAEHQRCKFASKSSSAERCMHYYPGIDGHCDCLAAQDELKTHGPR